MRVDGLIKHFQVAIEKGWVKPDDELIVEWWSYDDVFAFIGGDEYYGELSNDDAREVWAVVSARLSDFDAVDNDIVRDTVSEVLDERMEGK